MMNIWTSRVHNSNFVSLELFVNSQASRLESGWGLKGRESSREHTSPSNFQLRCENANGFSLSTCSQNGVGGAVEVEGENEGGFQKMGRNFGVKACDFSSGSCSPCSRLVSKNPLMQLVNRM